MSNRDEISAWVDALESHDEGDWESAVTKFENMDDPTSKIHFNRGVIFATHGQHESAAHAYDAALKQDNCHAISYFQKGVSLFLMGNIESALVNFEKASNLILTDKDNVNIDYNQLGLEFKLYACEALFNVGICYYRLNRRELATNILEDANRRKVADYDHHKVIPEAITGSTGEYTVFSISGGILYRPPKNKVANLKAQDFLGKPTLVAASQESNSNTGFSGDSRLGRRQSAPPVEAKKSQFPPTPPPDQSPRAVVPGRSNLMVRTQSARGVVPPPLNIGQQGPSYTTTRVTAAVNTQMDNRIRSSSERPQMHRSPKYGGPSPGSNIPYGQQQPSNFNPHFTQHQQKQHSAYSTQSQPPSSLPYWGEHSFAEEEERDHEEYLEDGYNNAPSARQSYSQRSRASASQRPTSRTRGPSAGQPRFEKVYIVFFTDLERKRTRKVMFRASDPLRTIKTLLTTKFGVDFDQVELYYKDGEHECGIYDDDDYQIAISQLRENNTNTTSVTLEVWCQ